MEIGTVCAYKTPPMATGYTSCCGNFSAPIYSVSNASVPSVRCSNKSSSDTPNVGDHDGDMSETKLTERQQKILNLVKESPTITGKQMSEMLSVSQRTIELDLSAMQKNGILKHEGKDNDGMWVVLST